MNLLEQGPKSKWTEFSWNSQFYSEHQSIFTLRVKKNHKNEIFSHKKKLHREKICFFHRGKRITTAEVNSFVFAETGRSTK